MIRRILVGVWLLAFVVPAGGVATAQDEAVTGDPVEDSMPVGGQPVYDESAGMDQPVGGAPVYGEPSGPDPAIGGEPVYGAPAGPDPAIGGSAVTGGPVEDEPLY